MTPARRPRRRSLPSTPAPLVLPLPTAWARERITAAGGDLPDYGSAEWHALADEDPRKLAAALVAAEVHRYEAATLADRLTRELNEARHAAAVEELHDTIEHGARRAMRRDERLAEHARKVGESGARRLATGPVALYSDPVPVAESDGWPPVRFPAARPGAAVVPSTGHMIRALAQRAG